MAPPSGLSFDYVSQEDLESAIRIEREGYPEDEAASPESLRYRQANAGSLFVGAYLPASPPNDSRRLIGFICSTLSPDETLTHHSMAHHVPGSSSVCIHSVVVDKDYRRQGVALALLKEYLTRLTNTEGSPYKRVLLITHEELRELYEKAGFTWIGPSDVVHGGRPWFEMRVELATPGQPRISSDALQALLRPSKEKLEPNFISDYHHGVDDLIVQDDDAQGISLNKYDLLCPRGCRSVILKAKAAQWTERTSVAMEPSDFKHALLPPLPPPPETAQWWLVKPSPMAFENIGFSRPAGTLSTGKRLKLLTCAECDLGPLGWCEEGGSEFWLATSRVGYRKV